MNITPTSIVKNRYLRAAALAWSIVIWMQVYSVQKDVNQVVASTSDKASENKTLKYHLEKVQKYFPDNLKGDEFEEKLYTLEGTIRAYEDIIMRELDDPVNGNGINLIERQSIEMEQLVSEYKWEERLRKIYTKFREDLAELLLFIEINIPKEPGQCRNPNITV